MPRLHPSQAPMAGQRRGVIGGAGRDDEIYDNFLDLDGCYFVYIFVKDPGRSRKLEARKEAERRREERICAVPLSEFSRHRVLKTGVGGGFFTVDSG